MSLECRRTRPARCFFPYHVLTTFLGVPFCGPHLSPFETDMQPHVPAGLKTEVFQSPWLAKEPARKFTDGDISSSGDKSAGNVH